MERQRKISERNGHIRGFSRRLQRRRIFLSGFNRDRFPGS